MWTTQKRFVAAACGRGSGKTEIAKRRLAYHLAIKKPWPDPKYFYAAPTVNQAKRISWQSFMNLIPKKWITHISLMDLKITTIFGSELWIIGLDKPQRIEGVQWDGCVVDESCDIKPGTFDLSILPALSHRKAWSWRIGVPKRFGVGAAEFRDFWQRGIDGHKDIDSFNWPSSDILSEDDLRYAKENLDPRDFAEQFQASWLTVSGQIYSSYNPYENIKPCHYDPEKRLCVGMDFNVDPMCWIIGHNYADRFEVIDEIFRRNTTTVECLSILWQRYKDHEGGFSFYGDATSRAKKTSASKSDYVQIYNDERFQSKKVLFPDKNPAIHDRFAAVNALLCNADGERRLYVDSSCKNLADDLELHSFKPGTNQPDESNTDRGHMTDGLGYLVMAVHPIKVFVPTKNRIGVFYA
jgi:hypothetical protein